MDTVWKSAVQPVPVGLDAEIIESCLGQTAVSPTAFKCHLSKDDGSGNAVFLLLSHGGMGISLEKCVRRKKSLLADMESSNTLQLYVSYVSKEVIGVFESSP